MDLKEIINKIKEKREFSSLEVNFIISSIEPLMKKYHGLSLTGPKTLKIFIKEARAKLRLSAGMFQANSKALKKRIDLLAQDKIEELLETHVSTKERISDYLFLKKILQDLNVKSVLDIGCGLNPLALASKSYIYNACDINVDELSLIKEFFAKKGISGEVFVCDLSKADVSKFPRADICLFWKLFDILEKRNLKKIEQIIREIPSNYVWISFSTKTLSGKPMRMASRPWMEKILANLKYPYKFFKIENETFYLISKNSSPIPLSA